MLLSFFSFAFQRRRCVLFDVRQKIIAPQYRMNILNLFRKQPQKEPPTPFETMAAFSRFQNVEECSPDFYQKHHDAIDMTVGFIGFLGQQHGHFTQIYTFSNAPISDIARTLGPRNFFL
jgi:hypothetical protein